MSDIKDMMNENEAVGEVKISEDVVEVLTDKAAKEIDGVAGLAAGFLDSVADVFGKKKSGAKGVDVEIKENAASITVHVIIKYGCRIPEIAWRIQEAVKNTVESMTSLEVLKVNVYVDGVKFEEECAPAEE